MNNNFSENLKKIRKDNNLSQEQLAEELGVSRQAISKWESSVAYPEMDKIITLCNKFNLNIDDLLNKDIREIKGEEETKKNINKYIDDVLNFITNVINMFSNMSFKSKIKCLFEQIIIICVLFLMFIILGIIGKNIVAGIFGVIPNKLYYVIFSFIQVIYILFSTLASIVVIIHIFKTRYLDYYNKIKKEVAPEELKIESKEIDKPKKIEFKNDENKIIIRDPKHSEYKFINGLSKLIVNIIKIIAFLIGLILCLILICLFSGLIISFLIHKTGFFFIGLILFFLSSSIIDIIFILVTYNFIFNRKNDKKKLIWSLILSLIFFGISLGCISIGTLNFEYIKNDNTLLKTDYLEFDMNKELFFDSYIEIEYIESNIKNVKLEYEVNKYCDIDYSDINNNQIHLWSICDNPIILIKEVINNLNNKKIIDINNEIKNLKLYASKENINIIKNNHKTYYDNLEDRQTIINEYEQRINKLQQKIDEYVEKEYQYQEEISELKDQIFMYESEE